MNRKKKYGERIRVLRKRLGLTLEEFAKPLSIKGTTVSSYERDKARASEGVLRELETHYQLNRVWYETGEGEMLQKSHDPVNPHGTEKFKAFTGEWVRADSVVEPPVTFPTPLHQMFWEAVLQLTEDEILEELLLLRRKKASRDKNVPEEE